MAKTNDRRVAGLLRRLDTLNRALVEAGTKMREQRGRIAELEQHLAYEKARMVNLEATVKSYQASSVTQANATTTMERSRDRWRSAYKQLRAAQNTERMLDALDLGYVPS